MGTKTKSRKKGTGSRSRKATTKTVLKEMGLENEKELIKTLLSFERSTLENQAISIIKGLHKKACVCGS